MSVTAESASQESVAAGHQAASVEFTDVVKRYGDVEAVSRLSFKVEQGQFLTLLGPSGCGKTTTLRLIGGFEQADAGRITIGGQDVTGTPPYRRPVTTVFQQYALFPHLTVRKNISYGLKHARVPSGELEDRVTEIMELMEIPDVGDRKPAQLSGGQQQRVALARALVMRPKVLLLDEPLGSLDYKLRKSMQYEIKRIHRELGTTFIYVTHDQEEAMTMSDRIIVMSRGGIEQDGSPGEIYDLPETPFVADFIGDTNLLGGTVAGRDGDLVSVDLGILGRITGRADWPAESGDRVRVSVRPTDLTVEADPGGATVKDAVLAGSYVTMTITGNSEDEDVTVHSPRGGAIAPGDGVRIKVDSERVRIFREGA